MLKLNSQSYDVAAVQSALNQIAAGRQQTMLPYLVPDGVFGVKTHTRVVEFQRMNGLKPDGVVGPKTLAAIGELLPAVMPTGRPVGGVIDPTNAGVAYKPRKPEGWDVAYKPRKPEGGSVAYKPRKPEGGEVALSSFGTTADPRGPLGIKAGLKGW